jgi:hypothetical protein
MLWTMKMKTWYNDVREARRTAMSLNKHADTGTLILQQHQTHHTPPLRHVRRVGAIAAVYSYSQTNDKRKLKRRKWQFIVYSACSLHLLTHLALARLRCRALGRNYSNMHVLGCIYALALAHLFLRGAQGGEGANSRIMHIPSKT